MAKKLSERQRWVRLRYFRFFASDNAGNAAKVFDELHAVIAAFEKIGRVVRIETHEGGLVLKARR